MFSSAYSAVERGKLQWMEIGVTVYERNSHLLFMNSNWCIGLATLESKYHVSRERFRQKQETERNTRLTSRNVSVTVSAMMR